MQKSFAKQPLVEARLRMTLGLSFLLLSEPRIAADLFERARAIYLDHLGPNDATTLECMSNLATAYDDSGRDADALKLRKQTLAIRRSYARPRSCRHAGEHEKSGQ